LLTTIAVVCLRLVGCPSHINADRMSVGQAWRNADRMLPRAVGGVVGYITI